MTMRIYGLMAALVAVVLGTTWFYGYAYDKGYTAHRLETENKAVQCVINARQGMITAGEVVQKVQKKIERKKTKDEMCRDIMGFDVRQCL